MSLKKYVVRRIGQLIVTYWAFLTLLFVVFRLAPGDPTSMYLQEGLSAQERQEILARHGLDQPLHIQYVEYMAQYLTGDLGQSFRHGVPVWDVLVVRFFNTIILMGLAFSIAYVIGVTVGAFIGWVRGTRKEKAGIIVTLVARSSPEFWIGILTLMVFTFYLGWFPSGGIRPPGMEYESFLGRYVNWGVAHHLVLPVLTGVIYYMATPTLLMRSSMINVLNSDFIQIKRAEGIPEYIILYKHAARNSILPMTTVVALVVGMSIGGSLVIETVFSWPGMGREMVESVTYNDYPLAQAIFFLMGSIVIWMNFVADLAYVYLDPRVRYD
ncbi:ABC transporter permease [Natrarchaeobius halalkaliphilus]|uniref:ABC transporter permease n=1 Tax=Natrarchaeobius halalkaliphilus TaxID=1679091 RepID=A0A3N6LS42_9EURY|nr:ABC transporter permease [Natrarchaeobius halalkaliphilus]RQG90054.1 ABC transporter permease [Natrarchaeobius halalkaliphilus]